MSNQSPEFPSVGARARFTPNGLAFISRRGEECVIVRAAKGQRFAIDFADGLRLYVEPSELSPLPAAPQKEVRGIFRASETTETPDNE
jgi:hypothetical protein